MNTDTLNAYIYTLDFSKMSCLSYMSTSQRNKGETGEKYISYALREIGKYISTTERFAMREM